MSWSCESCISDQLNALASQTEVPVGSTVIVKEQKCKEALISTGSSGITARFNETGGGHVRASRILTVSRHGASLPGSKNYTGTLPCNRELRRHQKPPSKHAAAALGMPCTAGANACSTSDHKYTAIPGSYKNHSTCALYKIA